VDGHDLRQLTDALNVNGQPAAPRVVIAHTVFGKGVSYMEGRIKWHYWPMSDAEYDAACREVEGAG
jgi:transketolase